MLTIKDLNTHYGASHVLQGVDLDRAGGPYLFSARPQWRRQDDDTAHGDGTGSAKWWDACVLDGSDITGWPPHRVARAGVAYVPEGRLIFPDLTVIENIRVAERRAGAVVADAALDGAVPAVAGTCVEPWRHAVGRRAADAGDRACAGERSEGDAAG